MASTGFALVVVGVVLIFVLKAIRTVPQGYEWTVERFGRYTRTLTPGLHVLTPFVEQVGRKITTMEQVVDIPRQEVITKDNAMVSADAVVFFTVLQVQQAAYAVEHLERAMGNLAMTNIRSVLGGMDLDQVLSERNQINLALLKVVDEATRPWGVKVNRIEIKDIRPPEDVVSAMGQQLKAEREKRAVILEAEGRREAAIKQAEGEKAAAIAQAEGRLAAAQKDAEARRTLAEAEAKATEVVAKAAENGAQALQYFLGLKYVEALQSIGSADNQRVVFMPYEATNMLGSLGGIVELLRTAPAAGGKARP